MDIRCLLNTCCNYKCVFCHNEFQPNTCRLDKDYMLSFSEEAFKKIVSEISKNYGLGVLKISGGEPLLAPMEIFNLLRWALEFPFQKKILFSNLSMVTEAMLELFHIKGMDQIRVNIPSFDEGKYRLITRTNGYALCNILENCRIAKAKGLSIRANMVVSEYSIENIFRLMDEILNTHNKHEVSIDEYAVLFDAYLGSNQIMLKKLMQDLSSTTLDVSKQSDRKYVIKIDTLSVYIRQCLDWENPSNDIDRGEIRIAPPGRKIRNYMKGKAYVD